MLLQYRAFARDPALLEFKKASEFKCFSPVPSHILSVVYRKSPGIWCLAKNGIQPQS